MELRFYLLHIQIIICLSLVVKIKENIWDKIIAITLLPSILNHACLWANQKLILEPFILEIASSLLGVGNSSSQRNAKFSDWIHLMVGVVSGLKSPLCLLKEKELVYVLFMIGIFMLLAAQILEVRDSDN